MSRYIDENNIEICYTESFDEDFTRILRELDLPTNYVNQNVQKVYSVPNLKDDTMRTVEQSYAEDFARFGYPIGSFVDPRGSRIFRRQVFLLL